MVSNVDLAKRALVTLLNSLAALYNLVLGVTRESSDADVRGAYKKLSRKCHPDRGGNGEHQKAVNAAHDAWQEAKKTAQTSKEQRNRDRRSSTSTQGNTEVLPAWRQNKLRKDFRFQSAAVLLTYQKFEDPCAWKRFLVFVRTQLFRWTVKYWCATMETNQDGTHHLHLALQFYNARDRTAQNFSFEGVTPNASSNDSLGEGWCRKRWQESVDRAFFYVWANKVGTAVDESNSLCVEGNRQPAWTNAQSTYRVKGNWLDKLLQAYKLTLSVYEEYLYKCRDGLALRKRNLDLLKAKEEEQTLKRDVEERTKALRSDPSLYQPFKEVPEAVAWLTSFQTPRLRYPVLVVHAPSHTGKTEWASSLFRRPLELKVGALSHFPEGMRAFDRSQDKQDPSYRVVPLTSAVPRGAGQEEDPDF